MIGQPIIIGGQALHDSDDLGVSHPIGNRAHFGGAIEPVAIVLNEIDQLRHQRTGLLLTLMSTRTSGGAKICTSTIFCSADFRKTGFLKLKLPGKRPGFSGRTRMVAWAVRAML